MAPGTGSPFRVHCADPTFFASALKLASSPSATVMPWGWRVTSGAAWALDLFKGGADRKVIQSKDPWRAAAAVGKALAKTDGTDILLGARRRIGGGDAGACLRLRIQPERRSAGRQVIFDDDPVGYVEGKIARNSMLLAGPVRVGYRHPKFPSVAPSVLAPSRA